MFIRRTQTRNRVSGEQGYHYVVVSKLRERQFDPALATSVQSGGDVTIKLQRVLDAQGHVLLYCHSPAREEKDRAIDTAKASGLEAALAKLQASLSKPKGTPDMATIMQRPVFHRIDRRVEGHLFISVLAYHFVHTLRLQLKAQGINLFSSVDRLQVGADVDLARV